MIIESPFFDYNEKEDGVFKDFGKNRKCKINIINFTDKLEFIIFPKDNRDVSGGESKLYVFRDILGASINQICPKIVKVHTFCKVE